MKIFGPDFRIIDGVDDDGDGADSASNPRFQRLRGSATATPLPILGTTLGLLAGIWADYDGRTDPKRRGEIFIIGSPLAIPGSEIRFCVSSTVRWQMGS
ncbi:hypothetical protein JCM30237_10780 [Halolamina litorea]